jgi:hypothetical protein
MGEAELGPGGNGQKLECDQGGRNTVVAQGHGGGRDDALVGDDVLKCAGVCESDTGKGCTGAETIEGTFLAARTEVHLVLFDGGGVPFGKPAALLGWVGEGFEEALGRVRVAMFDDKGGVGDRGFHGADPFGRIVK